MYCISELIKGIGESNIGIAEWVTVISISPTHTGEFSITIVAFVLSKVTLYLPNCKEPLKRPHLAGIELVDDPSNNDPIHLLIYTHLFGVFLLEGLKKGKINESIDQNTIFGLIIFVDNSLSNLNSQSLFPIILHYCIINNALDASLKRFWEVKEILPLASCRSRMSCARLIFVKHVRTRKTVDILCKYCHSNQILFKSVNRIK